MGKESPNPLFALALCASLCLQSLAYSAMTEDQYFRRITDLYGAGDRSGIEETSRDFFKAYPSTRHVPEVRLMLAELEKDPEEAVRQYRVLVEKYRYYPRRDYAQYRTCEVLYLLSRWDDLAAESGRGAALFGGSPHGTEFKLMLAKAHLYRENYEEAWRICMELSKPGGPRAPTVEALLMMAYLERRTSGYSREYLRRLRDLAVGFRDTSAAPAALYLMGRFYEEAGDYNKAYSAYGDTAKRFPRSPESQFARGRMEGLAEFKPARKSYLPDDAELRERDAIDIRPETDLEDPGDAARREVSYAVSLGPFYSPGDCREIMDLIKGEAAPISTVRVGARHMIHAGRFSDSDSALPLKIRLAEEFGLNGTIVRIRASENRRYIYGE